MIVSTRGRYALRVMIDIAEHPNEPYIPLKSIAARQGISEKYLESILKILVQEHLLEGMRGKGGGYRLTMSPSEYTIGRILRLTETSLEPVGCIESGSTSCPKASECRTIGMWMKLGEIVNDYLDSITLADLLSDGQAGLLFLPYGAFAKLCICTLKYYTFSNRI